MLPFFKYLIIFLIVITLGGIGAIIDHFLDTDIFKYTMVPIVLWLIYFKLRKIKALNSKSASICFSFKKRIIFVASQRGANYG